MHMFEQRALVGGFGWASLLLGVFGLVAMHNYFATKFEHLVLNVRFAAGNTGRPRARALPPTQPLLLLRSTPPAARQREPKQLAFLMAPRKYIDLTADHDPAPLRGGPGVAGRMSLSGSGTAAAAAPEAPRKRQRLVSSSAEADDRDLTEALASGLAPDSDDEDAVVTHVRTAADRTAEARAQAIALDREEPNVAPAAAADSRQPTATAGPRASNDQQPAAGPPAGARRLATLRAASAKGSAKKLYRCYQLQRVADRRRRDARPALIKGIHGDTRGVTLLVVDGEVKSNATLLADVVAQGREDEATRVIFSAMKTTIADARLALGRASTTARQSRITSRWAAGRVRATSGRRGTQIQPRISKYWTQVCGWSLRRSTAPNTKSA